MATILLLVCSNCFMTLAWYGHLKFTGYPLWKVVLASWGIAFFEYCLMVPANRIGSMQFDKYQLKIIQEIVTLSVFVGFAILYFKEMPRWNHALAFLCIIAAALFAFVPSKS